MRIYLIGMPGSGKSTIGSLLASKLNFEHIDLDGQIEKNSLMFIDEIIDKLGVKRFRELETENLEQIINDNVVISCGGGIVENRKNKKLMDGIIVYLDVDNSKIEKRLENDYDRPLLMDTTIEDLYNKRFLYYQHFANINVSNNGEMIDTVENIIEKIKDQLWKKF